MTEENRPQAQKSMEELKNTAKRALADAEQISFDVERLELEQIVQRKQTRRWWAFGLGLGVAIVAFTWFSIPLWKESKKLVAAVPAVRQAIEEIDKKAETTRKELIELSGQWDGVQKKISGLEKSVSAQV